MWMMFIPEQNKFLKCAILVTRNRFVFDVSNKIDAGWLLNVILIFMLSITHIKTNIRIKLPFILTVLFLEFKNNKKIY